MKTRITLLAAALLALAFTPVHAAMATFNNTPLGLTSPLAGATTYTINSTPMEIRKDCGIGVLASFTPAAATNAVTLAFQVSNDKTNWAVTTPLNLTMNLTTATTNYVSFTNFSSALVNNAHWFRLATVTAANTNALTNAVWCSYHY
jgi:hypothetical protein